MNPKEEQKKALWRKEKHLEFKEELRKNEKFMKFLEKTYPFARERFLDEYAQNKVNCIEWGPSHKKWLEQDDLKWIDNATQRLGEILQKKLFDMQCLWRAEKIKIPEIKLTNDFVFWEDNIFNCHFIEPVTQSEVDMYIQYLQSSNFEHSQGFLSRWQDYRELKKAYNDSSQFRTFPDWYEFHNGRTGLSAYMLLPDIRGEKEEFYLDLWRNENRKKAEEAGRKAEEEKNNPQPITSSLADTDARPPLQYHKKGWMTWFINTFEDKETQDVYKRYGGERAFDDYDEFLENDLDTLAKAGKPVPVNAWFDWKEAIHRAADKYSREKIAEALPDAYEQYKLKVEMGIDVPEENPLAALFNWYPAAILRGRELNGEPRNFNF